MLFNTTCKTGKLQVTGDGLIQVVSFGKTVWQENCSSVASFDVKHGKLMVSALVHAESDHLVEMLSKKDIERLQALFPQAKFSEVEELTDPAKALVVPTKSREIVDKPARQKPRWLMEWWEDDTKLTHVGSYDNDKKMAKEVEAAYQHGWQIQGQSAQGGKSSAGKVIAGAFLAGPVGALAGAASKGKGKTTLTFVRSQEWLDQHPRNS